MNAERGIKNSSSFRVPRSSFVFHPSSLFPLHLSDNSCDACSLSTWNIMPQLPVNLTKRVALIFMKLHDRQHGAGMTIKEDAKTSLSYFF
jgi:hypothetical protein